MLNLTPHTIVIQTKDGTRYISPSGRVASVMTEEELLGTITIDRAQVPVVRRHFCPVNGLPDSYGPDNPIIVSSLVLEALKASGASTAGVYAPDTGSTAIRDDAGWVTAITRLVTA